MNRKSVMMSQKMSIACEKKDWKCIIILLEEGESVNSFHENGKCPLLLLAIVNEWRELAYYLLDHMANVNAKSETGYTPLMAAANNADLCITKVLIERGADTSQYSRKGLDARAHYVVMYGEEDCEILRILSS